ncbi:MAG: endonuclease/exonuclease/phosphatase family protein [Nitrospinota bacterium]|nr:endonuclease/exonuclease/phosphatase family protein [Nitrospinota bacterium]
MSIRIATFNAENLFHRYRFRKKFDPVKQDGFSINNLAFAINNEKAKKITADAIKAVDADIICLQEVESLDALDSFNSRYLVRKGYAHRIVIDSHDPRRIDVAVLSRFPFSHINTHRHERNAKGKTWLFSRDCLEVDVDVDNKTLSLYINHLKSMIGGRGQTKSRRLEQAGRVRDIVNQWWEPSGYKGNFVVLGDMNDYPDSHTSLKPLIEHPGLVNVVDRLPESERWTHYYAKQGEYSQLDYLLLSKSLAASNPGLPGVERRGLPTRAARAGQTRFKNVGKNNPKASDHCPLYMDLVLD